MNERYLQQALSAISVRRNNAQTIQQQHLAEIAQTVPEIMEINQQLSHQSRLNPDYPFRRKCCRTHPTPCPAESAGTSHDSETARAAWVSAELLRYCLPVPRLQRYRLCKWNILPLPIKTCRKTCHKRTEQVSSSATLSV